MTSVAGETWFRDPALARVFALLNGEGGEARVVGGAVRNSLMGLPVSDMDIATTLKPEEVMARAETAGVKCVPTGIKHGTVTLVLDGRPFEVTTLRRDVSTDGRHAEVAFTDDWRADAERRDLTVNALYADAEGKVHDYVGGLADIDSATIRFIGDAATRIEEDHLRILRFFRFFAHYGRGRPDAAGLKACAAARSRLGALSAERVWAEIKKLLSARDPGRALLWMRTAGVLTDILPETEKWGIDSIHGLIAAEASYGWSPDPLLRLAAIIPPVDTRVEAMADRLKMSGAERAALLSWASTPEVKPDMSDKDMRLALYKAGKAGMMARIKLALASQVSKGEDDLDALGRRGGLKRLLDLAEIWEKPVMPVKGGDLIEKGFAPGADMGAALKRMEDRWMASDFKAGKEELLSAPPL
ncbi:poly(A) polymerase [Rhizobium sp. SG_E_25_P2]|uniref:CCA tRNA nucleotidyltransferase n=1 Tax=Rhizobium sp. SG_E_25_P2 TaxID=2879942 RepID=UPI00247308D0|nr:CCA tRNA nucleotidyltransferase [Rhizobium sp. SG_E_25_P2]MDH6267006.1 poly(A) polymerase [Rhizobium sp. SG_E_25_P2]